MGHNQYLCNVFLKLQQVYYNAFLSFTYIHTMKPLLPSFCHLLGYLVIALSIFLPCVMGLSGKITAENWLFYRECSKLLMVIGALMILFAYSRNETAEMLEVRNKAVRNALFLTTTILFLNMLLRVATKDLQSVDSSTFLVFLIINVICLEFGMKKLKIEDLFRKKREK